MRIYSKLVIDIETGNVIEANGFDYDGPLAMAGAKKKSKQSTTVSLPPPTAEETTARLKTEAIQNQQLSDAGYTWGTDASGNPVLNQRPLTASEQADADFNTKMKQWVQDQMTGTVSPETKALVANLYQSQREAGNAEIDRSAREMAGSRGLDLTTDTPAMREATLAKGSLESSLRGAEAGSLLNQGNAQQLFAANYNQFQQQLQQQAFVNRQALTGGYNQTAQQFAQMRALEPTQKSTSYMSGGNGFLGTVGGLIQGLTGGGGLLGAGAGALGGFMGSQGKP